MARLITIRRVDSDRLYCRWEDGLEVCLPTALLRDRCPCAFCQGERVFDRYILPVRVIAPGMHDLVALEPVGNYGLRAVWKDGHNTGIYPWELLRRLCEEHGLREESVERVSQEQQERETGYERGGEAGSSSPAR
ncbi:MAG: DUF971 domain-containing protein [Candidatus Kapabacteria bacterium]|nr:DUF971 domain-containing protein [Candidatus Kapabacteria bacterium]MCS7169424.1 DUF971 domain-containing protein [Candidatus Kapabacteria bacterium]MDW7996653.1 DUF971 domain-containing protein [Bacteroidota bacterium]MDW8226143.1 DUF971 domain-containing protein [Bacteroidota bacterium]